MDPVSRSTNEDPFADNSVTLEDCTCAEIAIDILDNADEDSLKSIHDSSPEEMSDSEYSLFFRL